MSRVLIWKKIAPGGEYDIYRGIDSKHEYMWKSTFNVGNRLWFQGIMSVIDTNENEYEFLCDELTPEIINEKFDFIVLPMANIFNRAFRHYLNADTFSEIKIPVYVIACGAQADSYDDIDALVNDIGDLSKKFIRSIYNTGGEFALRGNITKVFFERLGFHSAVVTGCPSMYQNGRNFVAVNRKQNERPVKPCFNGQASLFTEPIEQYRNSVFIDQDMFWEALYSSKKGVPTFREELAFYCNCSPYYAKLLGEDRLRIFPDMYNWSQFLKVSQFDYSFGSRIHGTIMSILSGVPATLVAIDSRTQEMAEFFAIPFVKHTPGKTYSLQEFFELYERADYSEFNRIYAEKYQAYERFLVQHGIVSRANDTNSFFDPLKKYENPPAGFNQQYYQELYRKINRDKLVLAGAKVATAIKNSLL